jgi:hypothetical protein
MGKEYEKHNRVIREANIKDERIGVGVEPSNRALCRLRVIHVG